MPPLFVEADLLNRGIIFSGRTGQHGLPKIWLGQKEQMGVPKSPFI